MKRILIFASVAVALASCSNHHNDEPNCTNPKAVAHKGQVVNSRGVVVDCPYGNVDCTGNHDADGNCVNGVTACDNGTCDGQHSGHVNGQHDGNHAEGANHNGNHNGNHAEGQHNGGNHNGGSKNHH